MAGWVVGGYPGGSIERTQGDEFPWKQAPCKLVLHTTEGMSYPNWGYNKSSHVTIDPHGPNRSWRQHRSLDKPAWTLKAPAGVSTNSMGAIQIEIIGYAASIRFLKGDDLEYLLGFIRFILDATGISDNCSVLFGGSETSGVGGAQRMTAAEWVNYRGILGHQHVPLNDHWDPGDIPMQAVWLPAIKGEAPPTTPTPIPDSKEDEMYLIQASPRGTVALIGSGWANYSIGPDQVNALIRGLFEHKPPVVVTDWDFDRIIESVQGGWRPTVEVDTSGLTVKTEVSAEDKTEIVDRTVDGVKTLTQKFV